MRLLRYLTKETILILYNKAVQNQFFHTDVSAQHRQYGSSKLQAAEIRLLGVVRKETLLIFCIKAVATTTLLDESERWAQTGRLQ
jgi:hypothetical protein